MNVKKLCLLDFTDSDYADIYIIKKNYILFTDVHSSVKENNNCNIVNTIIT